MSDYRLYFLNGAGQIAEVIEFQCADDDDALASAMRRRDGRAMELWNLARLVRAFEAER